MSNKNFKKGDYVLCEYEGKEYTGYLTENPNNGIATVQICISAKRSDRPIFEIVNVSVDELKSFV